MSPQFNSLCQITKREKEIIELIVMECSTKEIANKLYLSVNTVKTHRNKIMQKLHVKNVAGIVRETLMRKLVPLNSMELAQ